MDARYEVIKKAVIVDLNDKNHCVKMKVLVITDMSACLLTIFGHHKNFDYKYLRVWEHEYCRSGKIVKVCCPKVAPQFDSEDDVWDQRWPYKPLSEKKLIEYYEYLL